MGDEIKKVATPARVSELRSNNSTSNSNMLQVNTEVTSIPATAPYRPDPSHCHLFSGCNAPNCPLDPKSMKARYYSGERICHFFWILCKRGGTEKLKSAVDSNIYEAVLDAYKVVKLCQSTILSRLNQGFDRPFRSTNQNS